MTTADELDCVADELAAEALLSQPQICVACGHSNDDHADGLMGARINDDWLCHEDDHSCYQAALWGRPPRFLTPPRWRS